MTTMTAPPPRHIGPLRAARHGLALAERGVLKVLKNPEQLADVVLMPIVLMTVFVYLFGGAISGDTTAYLQMVVPGVMVMTVMQVSLSVGMLMNADVSKGLFDRFRSLPIARTAPLVGAVLADVLRYLVCLTVLLVVALLMGYRVGTNGFGVLGAVGLAVLFGLCFCWVSVFLGMRLSSPGAVQGMTFILVMPLSFGSNVFVPSETMPGWLRAWAEISPVSLMANAMRGMMNGGPVLGQLLGGLAWLAGVLVVFVPLAMRAYRRRVSG